MLEKKIELLFIVWWFVNNHIIQFQIEKIPVVRLFFACGKCLSFITVLVYCLLIKDSILSSIGQAAIASYLAFLIQYLYDIIPIRNYVRKR